MRCAIFSAGQPTAAFVYSDHDTGRVTTILGYPIDELNQTA
jgi:hypothetical protein